MKNWKVVFANADKNLGHVCVTLERYIKNGLDHLMDKNTYEIISECEAYKNDATLRKIYLLGLFSGANRLETML